MKTKFHVLSVCFAVAVAMAGCSSSPLSPTAPSAASGGTLAAASDGSTLKVTPPAIIIPIDGITVDSRTPTLAWANADGYYGSVGLAYELQVSTPTAVVYERVVGETPNTGLHKVELELAQDVVHSWRVRAALGGLIGPWSIWADFRTPAPPPPPPPTTTPTVVTGGTGFRTPDPPPSQRLPRINHVAIVQRVAAANPAALRNSCQDQGGSWLFMDLLVDALQATDLRWGYNAKRGNTNDPSQDVVSYHWGAGPSEGSANVYIIDTLNGHCGPSPSPTWNDVTDLTISSGTIGRYLYRRPGRR